jgi:hypothetical protein
MGNKREHDGDEHRRRDRSIDHAEIEEAEETGRDHPDQVHLPPSDTIGNVAGERDSDEGNHGRHHDGGKDEVTVHLQRVDRIGENESREDVERRLLGHPRQRRQDDLARLLLDDFEDRRLLDAVGFEKLLKHRSLENAEADPQAHSDQNDRERERDTPAPDHELIAGPGAEYEHRHVRQEQAGRHAELRP